jgi:hypothetical protein
VLLVAFYDIHRGKREVRFFYFVPDTTRDTCSMILVLMLFDLEQHKVQNDMLMPVRGFTSLILCLFLKLFVSLSYPQRYNKY